MQTADLQLQRLTPHPTTPVAKCGKNSIGINAFLEGIWLCAVGFGEKCIEKYGLFVDSLF